MAKATSKTQALAGFEDPVPGFSISKSALLDELGRLVSVAPSKNTTPALANVLIEAGERGVIVLTATDLEVTLQTECEAAISRIGSVALPARRLHDIVKNVPAGDDINVSWDDKAWGEIKCGGSHFKLAGIAKEHFPPAPVMPKSEWITLPGEALSSLIKRTEFAITNEESRYALNGALFRVENGNALMVATDGHRLAVSSIAVESAAKFEVLIPRKGLVGFQQLAGEAESDVQFSLNDNHIFVQAGRRRPTSRRVTGKFPDYTQIMPRDSVAEVEVNASALIQVLKRVELMADERSHGIKVEIANNLLTVSSRTPDLGEAKDSVPVEFTGEAIEIGFNARYLLDFVSSVGTEQLRISLKDGQSPALFQPVGADYEHKYVVMPMRIDARH